MTDTIPDSISLDDLYPIPALVDLHPEFLSVATLRWQLRHRDTNGLAHACRKVGKKILISKSRYEQWLASQVGSAA